VSYVYTFEKKAQLGGERGGGNLPKEPTRVGVYRLLRGKKKCSAKGNRSLKFSTKKGGGNPLYIGICTDLGGGGKEVAERVPTPTATGGGGKELGKETHFLPKGVCPSFRKNKKDVLKIYCNRWGGEKV